MPKNTREQSTHDHRETQEGKSVAAETNADQAAGAGGSTKTRARKS